jgi:hypothetical protein
MAPAADAAVGGSFVGPVRENRVDANQYNIDALVSFPTGGKTMS